VAIADNDIYVTDRRRARSLFSKIFLSPRYMFYPQAFHVVCNNGRAAKQGRYGNAEWVQGSLDILHALENVGVAVKITGMSNIRKFDGPAVFIGNHMSTLETFVLPCIVQPVKEVTFIVKKSLVTMAVFGPVMRSRDPVVVGRENPREDLRVVLEEGVKKIAAGRSIIVFPQSTRSVVFKPEEFNTLGVKLASRAGVPVVPVALKTDAWGVGKIMKDFGPIDRNKKVHIEFGEPMRVAGRGVEEHARVVAFIHDRLTQWEREETR
jgi:1-acyl-sn-glycerol-3-phosphate acyltransferase